MCIILEKELVALFIAPCQHKLGNSTRLNAIRSIRACIYTPFLLVKKLV